MAVYARDGALNTSKDKDPWTTSNYAAYSGTSYVKGRTYIWASGSTVNLRSCWNDGCGTNDRQQDTIQVE